MGWLMVAAGLAAMQSETPATEGLPIELMVMTEVTTASARRGDPVKLRVHRPVLHDGAMIVPEGAAAFGEVLDLSRSGIAMKRGGLSIRLTRVVVNGRDLPLDGAFGTRGRGGKSDDLVKVVLAPFYFPFAPGNSGKFKAGEVVTGRLIMSPPVP